MALRARRGTAGRRRVLRAVPMCLAICLMWTIPLEAWAASAPAPTQSVHVTKAMVTAGGAAILVDTALSCRNPGEGVFLFRLRVTQNIGNGTVWVAGGSSTDYVISPVPCDGKVHVLPYLMSAADSFPAGVNGGPVPRWRAKPFVVDADFASTIGRDRSDVRAWPGVVAPINSAQVDPKAQLVQNGTALRIRAHLACPPQLVSQAVAAVSQVGPDGQVRGAMTGGAQMVCDGTPHTYSLIALASGTPWRPGVAAVQLDNTNSAWGLHPATVTVGVG